MSDFNVLFKKKNIKISLTRYKKRCILSQVKLLYKEGSMQIDERKKYLKLFDVYGKLLSVKQFDVMDKVLNLDLGESELAELDGESRQSIHDAIIKAKKQLVTFEEKCKIVETNAKIAEDLCILRQKIEDQKIKESKIMIDDILNSL